MPKLRFVISPKLLPSARKLGRTVLLDLAFAYGDFYHRVTRPFIDELGERMVTWIDHHPHPGWESVIDDPRFVLVDRMRAPACPELVTPQRVTAAGEVDDILAHGDFDGCVAAAKFVRGGHSPYPEADEDARAIDAPGRGFVCSPRGQRLASALDRARDTRGSSAYLNFVKRIAMSLINEVESPELSMDVDSLADAQRTRLVELERLLVDATQPHPDIVLLRAENLSNQDRKALLRWLEERARVAMLETGDSVTVATYDTNGLNLSDLEGLEGTAGLAWGKQVDPQATLDALVHMLKS